MTSLETEFAHTKGLNESDQPIEEFDAPNISAQEFAEHTANQTAGAFQATGMFDVVEVKAGVGQIHLLGRVKKDDERRWMELVIDPILRAIDRAQDCEGHICKQFLLKNDRTKYAWTISFASNDLRAAAHAICESMADAIPKLEVTESPLVGAGTPMGGGPKGGRKGAMPVK